MDPNATLDEIRRLVPVIANGNGNEHDAMRLAELIDALDEWITRAGYLPAPWGTHWRGVRS